MTCITHLIDDGKVWDDVNNVEQATVVSVPSETLFSVHVRATNIPFGMTSIIYW
jgi:hypothetical protein